MLLQAKDAAAIGPDALEHAVPEQEAVIEDRNLRLVAVHEFAVQPDVRSHSASSFPKGKTL